ncbi:MAG: MFS transporter, partial [Myxococcota bacterium]
MQAVALEASRPARARQASPMILPPRLVVLYGLPLLGVGMMWNLINFYFMKFATDVLLIAPATMGVIFLVSRVWDAVSDPLVGYWGDRTRTRLGRRRPWMFASAIPLGLCFVAMWSPPGSLGATGLAIWTGAAVVLFYTALTTFTVPHASLGAELTPGYHTRTRLFTSAQIAEAIGAALGIAALFTLLGGGIDPRTGALWVSGAGALAAVALTFVAVSGLRENPSHWGRGPQGPLRAVADVWQNPHARRLLLAGLLQSAGLSTLVATIPYASQYALGDLGYMPRIMLAFVVPHVLLLPAWGPLSRRFGKREVWIVSRTVEAAAIAGLFFAPEIGVTAVMALAAIAGGMDGSTSVLRRSLQADAIDFDEVRT